MSLAGACGATIALAGRALAGRALAGRLLSETAPMPPMVLDLISLEIIADHLVHIPKNSSVICNGVNSNELSFIPTMAVFKYIDTHMMSSSYLQREEI